MISAGLWRRCFEEDPKILGRTVTLAAAPYTISSAYSQPASSFRLRIWTYGYASRQRKAKSHLEFRCSISRLNSRSSRRQQSWPWSIKHYRTAHPAC